MLCDTLLRLTYSALGEICEPSKSCWAIAPYRQHKDIQKLMQIVFFQCIKNPTRDHNKLDGGLFFCRGLMRINEVEDL